MVSNCNYLIRITNLRLFLKDNVYSRQEIIDQIIQSINNSFELFNVNYDPAMQSIKIKIKITNMKKRFPLYEHNSYYYYNIMNGILLDVFNRNQELLNTLYNMKKHEYGLDIGEDSNVVDISMIPHISGLYNITTLLDNIIFINL